MNGADKLRLQIHMEYTFKIHSSFEEIPLPEPVA